MTAKSKARDRRAQTAQPLTFASPASMREVAYAHIRAKIASRELPSGTPIVELSIARDLRISRTPTREALRQLITEGLLEEVPGRGALVARVTREDLAEWYDMREALEVHAVYQLASHGIRAEDLTSLRSLLVEMADLGKLAGAKPDAPLNDLQMERFESVDIGFHQTLLRLAGNRRSLAAASQARQWIQIFARRHKGHTRQSVLRVNRDHRDITDAIARKDADAATAAMRSHIQNSRRQRLEQFDLWERNREASANARFSLAG